MVEADHCTVACADSAGDQCGGPRGALSVYLSGSLASGPLDTAATVLRDEAGGAISGAVETGKDVYLEVKQGEFICTVINAVVSLRFPYSGTLLIPYCQFPYKKL